MKKPVADKQASPPATSNDVRHDVSLQSDQDLFLFNEGTNYRLYQRMGCHLTTFDGVEGANFAVWAPNAEQVTVFGDFNGWNKTSHPLLARGSSGVWEGFVPGVQKGAVYKYHIR